MICPWTRRTPGPASRGQEIALTPREFAVLEFLMSNVGRTVSKEGILRAVWNPHFEGDRNVVEVYIRYLRRKIDASFGRDSIATLRGARYRLHAVVQPGGCADDRAGRHTSTNAPSSSAARISPRSSWAATTSATIGSPRPAPPGVSGAASDVARHGRPGAARACHSRCRPACRPRRATGSGTRRLRSRSDSAATCARIASTGRMARPVKAYVCHAGDYDEQRQAGNNELQDGLAAAIRCGKRSGGEDDSATGRRTDVLSDDE